VLCGLEGKTGKEAAGQLGCPEGTVASRLARARTLLAKRLARQGLTLSAVVLAEALSGKVASASVPVAVTISTIQAVTGVAAGQAVALGVVSTRVAALTEGVLKAMLLHKLVKGMGILLAVAVLSGVAGLIYRMQAREQRSRPAKSAREKVSSKVKKLMEQRVDALKRALKGSLARRRTDLNAPGIESILDIARQLRQAELALAARPEEKRAAQLEYFTFICEMDEQTIKLHEKGMIALPEVWLMRAARLDAEIELRQAGEPLPKDIKPAREIKERKSKAKSDK
jgi:hypothetical protein